MAELFRYAAFISYSSADAKFAQRLHRALEHYGIPASLGSFDLIGGGKKNRIYPVFRDREELPAGDLSERIQAALAASGALIVVCSPRAAASPWVEKEIQSFIALGRKDRIFAIIPDDAPLADEAGADATPRCFPPAFCGDDLADPNALEPLAADARKGKDGFRNAWLKLVAGLIGVTPGQLIDRDKKRRRTQRLSFGAGVSALAIAAVATVAVVGARGVRTDLTAHASDLTGQGRPLEAVAFALAGLPARGDVVGLARQQDTNALLRTSTTVAISASFNPLGWFQLSADGRLLLTREADARSREVFVLRDVSNSAAEPRRLAHVRGLEVGAVFSADDRYLVIWSGRAHGFSPGILYDLASSSTEGRELGPIYGARFLADGRRLLTWGANTDFTTDITLHHVADPQATAELVGGIRSGQLLPGERFLLTRDEHRTETLYDLSQQAIAPLVLGERTLSGWSENGRFLLTRRTGEFATLRDLARTSPTSRSLGRLHRANISNDGRYLLDIGPDGGTTLRDLANPAAEPHSFGPTDGGVFTRDSRFLITRHLNVNALRDLSNPENVLLSFGGSSFQVSEDSRFMIVEGVVDAGLFDLSNLDGAPRMFDAFASETFSTDSRWLMTIDTGGLGVLYDLADLAGAGQSLGPVRSFQFSSDSRVLLVDGDDGATIRDLTTPKPRAKGAALRAGICRASRDATRPFSQNVRLGTDTATAHLFQRLRGRPWNPCDWRGLLAVFPSAEHGDGWFEGLSQWFRLMHVRYFNARDWACEETTSRASERTRAARRDICERFADRDSGGEASTSPAAGN